MRRLFIATLVTLLTLGVSAQDNLEAFRHMGVGVEAGLHGFGVNVAMPVYKGLVVKAGYNFVPSGDLFNTQYSINTQSLKQAQEQYEQYSTYRFKNKFGDEAVIDAGLQLSMSNLKLLLDWYPFKSSSFYLTGGIYCSVGKKPFISIHGNTTENDWHALLELREKSGKDYDIALEIANEKYPVTEQDGCGYMQGDFKMAPLKYYLGLGLGRSVPNKRVGLQFELGAQFYRNAKFYLQDKEVPMADAAEQLGDAAKTAIGYLEKYPIYPQLAIRLNFLAF